MLFIRSSLIYVLCMFINLVCYIYFGHHWWSMFALGVVVGLAIAEIILAIELKD